MEQCIFCSIIAGSALSSVVHRDDVCIAFMDIQPLNPGHLLVVPLEHVARFADVAPAIVAHLFGVAQRLAGAIRRSGLRADGINLLLADGAAAGQEVDHVHLHVVPRFAGDGFGFHFGSNYGRPVPRERLETDAALIAGAAEGA